MENALLEVENSTKGKGKKQKSPQFIALNKQRVLDHYLGASEAEKTKRYKDPFLNTGPKAENPDGKIRMEDKQTEVELGVEFLG